MFYNTPEYRRDWYYKNKESARKSRRKYYQKNKKKLDKNNKNWSKENIEATKKIKKKWRDNNRELTRFYCFIRRKRVEQATPLWCDKEEILNIIKEASYFGLEIDHIIPIKHELVCGLNIPENLQLLSRSENRSKGNKFYQEDIIGVL